MDGYCAAHIVVWGYIPCVGGSLWQCANEVMYYRNGDEQALPRLRNHRTTFEMLFSAFQRLT
eukprot:6692120-Pyramimonas_sp.AAC.1